VIAEKPLLPGEVLPDRYPFLKGELGREIDIPETEDKSSAISSSCTEAHSASASAFDGVTPARSQASMMI